MYYARLIYNHPTKAIKHMVTVYVVIYDIIHSFYRTVRFSLFGKWFVAIVILSKEYLIYIGILNFQPLSSIVN